MSPRGENLQSRILLWEDELIFRSMGARPAVPSNSEVGVGTGDCISPKSHADRIFFAAWAMPTQDLVE